MLYKNILKNLVHTNRYDYDHSVYPQNLINFKRSTYSHSIFYVDENRRSVYSLHAATRYLDTSKSIAFRMTETKTKSTVYTGTRAQSRSSTMYRSSSLVMTT